MPWKATCEVAATHDGTLSWAIPCGTALSVIPTLGYAFFGFGGMAVVRAGLAAGIPLAMILAAKVFGGRLSQVTERSGLIMELPPYRKPKIKPLFKTAFRRYTIILWRAFKTIFMDGAHQPLLLRTVARHQLRGVSHSGVRDGASTAHRVSQCPT